MADETGQHKEIRSLPFFLSLIWLLLICWSLEKQIPPSVGKVTSTSVDLSWSLDPALKGSSTYHFNIQQSTQGHDWATVYSGPAPHASITALEPHTLYKFRLRLVRELGPGEWSPVITVTTTSNSFYYEECDLFLFFPRSMKYHFSLSFFRGES